MLASAVDVPFVVSIKSNLRFSRSSIEVLRFSISSEKNVLIPPKSSIVAIFPDLLGKVILNVASSSLWLTGFLIWTESSVSLPLMYDVPFAPNLR